MEPDVPAFLQERGVVLVGVDVPSVDDASVRRKNLESQYGFPSSTSTRIGSSTTRSTYAAVLFVCVRSPGSGSNC